MTIWRRPLRMVGLYESLLCPKCTHPTQCVSVYLSPIPVWADNANMCSLQYAGTGALKTDFTRTGKRTRMGAVKDGINSVTRYYYNNFVDGFRQDAMDLFLGNHIVSRDEDVTIPSVLQPPRNLRVTVVRQ